MGCTIGFGQERIFKLMGAKETTKGVSSFVEKVESSFGVFPKILFEQELRYSTGKNDCELTEIASVVGGRLHTKR